LQDPARLFGKVSFIERAGHQLQPAIAGRLSDSERRMPDTKPGMAALFDIGLRAAEAEYQEIAKPLPGGIEILRRIHRPENIVGWNLPVEGISQTLESGVANDCVNVLFFH
jgi:hypothetical protein